VSDYLGHRPCSRAPDVVDLDEPDLVVMKLGVGESADDHRGVLAVLTYLRSAPQQQT